MPETILRVEGMSCNHCRMAVEKALKEIPEVQEVDVNLDKKSARVTHGPGVTREELARAVEKAGYTVV
ncbi:copper resistance protein CopZ [Desulfofundulus thermobenzoicus]|uniref:Copper resistance protein CopZ n=1 Tax=Desulfofundulus thermobenzoicus TaxID=29376 RepID=A0A6N7IW51_9FIRM|nr:cation transporter [Desulfofundulus thermobenzoicus]MQL53368.1 copper resistance protein CopZ [Desulfofundulus thermobenzoicus]HHW43683.1 heavy-metal-associated domain-containing protein [Desulfotomaculum sp.]